MTLPLYQFNPELTKLRDLFINHLAGESNDRRRHTRYIRAINKLYYYLQKCGISDLNKLTKKIFSDFQKYLYGLFKYNEKIVNENIYDIEKFLSHLYYKELISINPKLPRFQAPKKPNHISRYYNFSELLTKYKTNLRNSKYKFGTALRKIKAVKKFFDYLQKNGRKTIYKVTQDDITSYINSLSNHSYKSMRKLILRLSQFFRFLVSCGMIYNNPWNNLDVSDLLKKTGLKPLPPATVKEIDILADKFITYFVSQGYAKKSAFAYRKGLSIFSEYCRERGITSFKEIKKSTILDYQIWLSQHIYGSGKKLCINTIRSRLMQLHSFSKYLASIDYIESDCCSGLSLPKSEDGLPRTCLTKREVRKILGAPDINTTLGLRDKAILETFYSTGARMNELLNIKKTNLENGYLRIDTAKGGKSFERIIPIGKVAVFWLQKYLEKARPLLLNGIKSDYTFLSRNGRRLTHDVVDLAIHNYRIKVRIRKNVTSHSFRVSCATHMLHNNAGIRYVQEQLGHRCIQSTIRYTRLVPKNLKLIHHKYHPREKEADSILCGVK